MHLRPSVSRSSGWVPAAILALATALAVASYEADRAGGDLRPLCRLGVALPGMLWVRFLRGGRPHRRGPRARPAVGYASRSRRTSWPGRRGRSSSSCGRSRRWWPSSPVPALRSFWRGSGERAPSWWSWSLAAMLGYPARLFGRDVLRAASPHRHRHAVRGHAVSPRPHRRAPPPRAARDPVRQRCPARLPLVLLRRGRGDELGDRHRALDCCTACRACRCSRPSSS